MIAGVSTRGFDERSKGFQVFLFRIFITVLVVVALAGATFLFLSLYLYLKEAPFLRLKEVRIKGINRLSQNEILTITELDRDQNILSLDIKTMNTKLGQHPWIQKSTIKRTFPDGILISVQERKPIAVIHLGKFYYVDERAVIFDQAKGRDLAAHPILTGIGREDLEKGDKKARLLLKKALQLLKMTQNHRILPYRSISQIHLDRALGLLVYTMKKGTEIRMGFGDFETKFQRISKIWSPVRQMDLAYIDVTIPGKIIVKQKRTNR
jgi:cell division protein FtsQ